MVDLDLPDTTILLHRPLSCGSRSNVCTRPGHGPSHGRPMTAREKEPTRSVQVPSRPMSAREYRTFTVARKEILPGQRTAKPVSTVKRQDHETQENGLDVSIKAFLEEIGREPGRGSIHNVAVRRRRRFNRTHAALHARVQCSTVCSDLLPSLASVFLNP